jgi:hypothetical protein
VPTPPADRLVHHFTHIDNVPAILREGSLLADAELTDGRLATDVGDQGIKDARRRRPVPLEPGGVVADYVPFYFAPRSPMLYRIACDSRDAVPGRYGDGEDPLVYLVSSVGRIATSGARWVATDGNAAAVLTRFTASVDDLGEFVDWDVMDARIWADDLDDLDRQRRRMAELLVHRRLPLSTLWGFATRTEQRRQQLLGILTAAGRTDDYVAVRPGWYYGIGRTGVTR